MVIVIVRIRGDMRPGTCPLSDRDVKEQSIICLQASVVSVDFQTRSGDHLSNEVHTQCSDSSFTIDGQIYGRMIHIETSIKTRDEQKRNDQTCFRHSNCVQFRVIIPDYRLAHVSISR
jgi:hypothetical protein